MSRNQPELPTYRCTNAKDVAANSNEVTPQPRVADAAEAQPQVDS